MSASPKPLGQEPRTPEEIAREIIFGDPAEDIIRSQEAFKAKLERIRNGGASGGPPKDDREKTIHNERTKLSATLLNGLALAFLVAGSVTFAANVGTLPSPADQFVRSIVWILAGIGLHWIGRLILGSMRWPDYSPS